MVTTTDRDRLHGVQRAAEAWQHALRLSRRDVSQASRIVKGPRRPRSSCAPVGRRTCPAADHCPNDFGAPQPHLGFHRLGNHRRPVGCRPSGSQTRLRPSESRRSVRTRPVRRLGAHGGRAAGRGPPAGAPCLPPGPPGARPDESPSGHWEELRCALHGPAQCRGRSPPAPVRPAARRRAGRPPHSR